MVRIIPVSLAAFVAALPTSALASAESEISTADRLGVAQRQIQKKRLQARSDALAPRAFPIADGSRWEVLAFQYFPEPGPAPVRDGRARKFGYEARGNGEIRIRALDASPDPSIEDVLLRLDSRGFQIHKSYGIAGKPGRLEVSPRGLKTRATVLELFPLDAPNVTSRDRIEKPARVPRLPDSLQKAAAAINWDSGQWYELSDAVGRPTRVLWDPQEPWPKYMETPYGISILVREGA